MGVVCIMGVAIGLSRLIEVELDPIAPPALAVSPAAPPEPLEESPGSPPLRAPTPPAPVAAAPAPTPTPPASAAGWYVVQAGETLGTISQKVFGTTRHWKKIVDANPGIDPAHLRPGQRVRLPQVPGATRH